MEKKKIVIEQTVSLAGLSIVPVVEVVLRYSETKTGIFYYYSRRPTAIIISSKSGEKVIRITGEEIPPYQLVEDFPDIDVSKHILHSTKAGASNQKLR